MKLTSIESLATVVRGSSPRPQGDPKYYGGKIPRLMVSDVSRDGMYVTPKTDSLTELGATMSRSMKKGDFIIAVSGNPGEPCILNCDACIHDGFVGLRDLKVDRVDVPYLYYFFKWNKEANKSQAVGAIYKNLNTDQIKKLKIPLPQLAAQKKIAAILDAADEHRQKTNQLLAKYDELAQSIFLEMFGDPVTNPKEWKKVKLGSITSMKAGKFVSASEIFSERENDMYECYGGNGLRGYVKSHTHNGEFVLIGRQGALCGNVKIASGIFHATEHAIVCSPKKEYETMWLYFLLDLINLNKYATGAAQPGLNVGKLVEVEIVFPSRDLQIQFVERLDLIETQKINSQKELDQSEKLFHSLLQKAFKGELVK